MKITSEHFSIKLNIQTGGADFEFPGGLYLKNTIASFQCNDHLIKSSGLSSHEVETEKIEDKIGKGLLIHFAHKNDSFRLTQYITLYHNKPFLLIGATGEKNNKEFQTNYFSPLSVTAANSGSGFIPGSKPRLLDMPFDNDNWTKALTVNWNDTAKIGTGYEFTSFYDYDTQNGVVIGSLTHDFWKTGIQYSIGNETGMLNTLVVYGGAATADNKIRPNAYGGYDGTHDVVAHGSMKGKVMFAPLIFIGVQTNTSNAFRQYGEVQATLSGALKWDKPAPFYWNSFGVENVLGHKSIMMPSGVAKISDFLYSLKNFNNNQPVLSIDSYDQGIYNTSMLKTVSSYAQKHHQQMGFYFIPFAIWTWKDRVDKDKLQHTDYYIKDASLKDNNGKTIIYKDGSFGAFPLDPTHPATRQRIIAELTKAKEINAKFLKIDFLTAGALETPFHYNAKIRSGMQAYNYGMKMLKNLIDSILGPDVFITQAISPTFPSQYAHARFLSTDIYSHFRDDMSDFPHYGGTASSMITNSHLGWMQGTIVPYTNLDVLVMKNFQQHAGLSDRDIRARLFALISLGSILGDGSDYRKPVAAERAKKYLNNKNVTDYFAHPRAFTPLKAADGLTQDQQLCFYLPGDTILLSSFNFNLKTDYHQLLTRKKLGLKEGTGYVMKDFLTDELLDRLDKSKDDFLWITEKSDSRLIKIIPQSK